MEDKTKKIIEDYKEYEKSTIQKMDALYEERRNLLKEVRKIEEEAEELNKALQNQKKDFIKTIRERNNQKKGIHPIKIKFTQEHLPLLCGYYLQVDLLKEIKEL